jgi:hypothetical protein
MGSQPRADHFALLALAAIKVDLLGLGIGDEAKGGAP